MATKTAKTATKATKTATKAAKTSTSVLALDPDPFPYAVTARAVLGRAGWFITS